MKMLLMLVLPMLLFSVELSKQNREKVDKFKKQFITEWDYHLDDEQKDLIIKYMEKAREKDLAWSAGGALLVESRGIKDRVNINYRETKKGTRVVSSFDCGKFGSNTYYHLKDSGIKKPTLMDQINACYEFNHDNDKSYQRFLTTIDKALEYDEIQQLEGTREYWWRIWTYYNTGSYSRLKGDYYLRMIAAIETLKIRVILKGEKYALLEGI